MCDDRNNTLETVEEGVVHCDVMIALVRPGEFVKFRVTQSAGDSVA